MGMVSVSYEAREPAIAEVFVFHDEVVRHQRGFIPVYAMLLAVALVVAAVGTLGLADALAASVVDRRRDIGLMRSLGASGARIAQVFWIEGTTLSLLAWVPAARPEYRWPTCSSSCSGAW
jgi:putative ABC transport system permease protein